MADFLRILTEEQKETGGKQIADGPGAWNYFGRKWFELPLFKPTGALRISGQPDDHKHFVVFLEVARTLPGLVRMIPQSGGQKYNWEKKITFHMDLEKKDPTTAFTLPGGYISSVTKSVPDSTGSLTGELVLTNFRPKGTSPLGLSWGARRKL